MSVEPSKRALELHAEACDANADGYIDPDSGYFVMTSVGLLRQGSCCGNGCRHCPYPPDEQADAERPNVPCWPLPNS